MIPKILHFVWFGSPPSWVRANADAFRRTHAGWEVILWTEPMHFWPADILGRCPLWCQRADVAYLWLLAEMGGVVVDCDTVSLRAMDDLLALPHAAWTTRHPSLIGGARRLTNGLMASEPGSPAIVRACEEARRIAAEQSSFARTDFGPRMLTRLFGGERCVGWGEMGLLPPHYFYPWGLLEGERETAHQFWRAGDIERERLLLSIQDRFADGVEPYSVHLWGVDGSSMAEAR